jgi:Flp pilus assembly protein TadD
MLVDYLIAAGRRDDALADARDFASAHPGPEADLLVASTLSRLNRADEGTKVLASRFAAKPDRLLARQLSENAKAMGDRKKAVAILVDWLRTNPNDFDVRLQYASLLSQFGDTAGSRKELETLLKQRPEDPTVLNNLGWNLREDDPQRSISLVSLAVKVAPDKPQIMDTLGWLKFQRKNDLQGALVLLRRAHELAASDGSIAYHFAVALDGTGRRAEAKMVLQSVLAKDSKFNERDTAVQLLTRW